MSMLGTVSKPVLSLKAAETEGLLEFACDLLEGNMTRITEAARTRNKPFDLEARLLLAAAKEAVNFEKELRSVPAKRRMDGKSLDKLVVSYGRFTVLFGRAGGEHQPKSHLMFECLLHAHKHGNPIHYHTYMDETLNGVIASIARSCHRLTWSDSVFRKINILRNLPSRTSR